MRGADMDIDPPASVCPEYPEQVSLFWSSPTRYILRAAEMYSYSVTPQESRIDGHSLSANAINTYHRFDRISHRLSNLEVKNQPR